MKCLAPIACILLAACTPEVVPVAPIAPRATDVAGTTATAARQATKVRASVAAIRTQSEIGDAGTGPLPRPINAPPSRPTDASE